MWNFQKMRWFNNFMGDNYVKNWSKLCARMGLLQKRYSPCECRCLLSNSLPVLGSDTPSLHTISSKWNEKLHPSRLTIMEAKNSPNWKRNITWTKPTCLGSFHTKPSKPQKKHLFTHPPPSRRPEGPPAVGESQEQGHNTWKTLYQQRYNSGCFSCLAKRGLPKKVCERWGVFTMTLLGEVIWWDWKRHRCFFWCLKKRWGWNLNDLSIFGCVLVNWFAMQCKESIIIWCLEMLPTIPEANLRRS